MSCAQPQITAWQPRTTILCVRRNVSHEFAEKFKPSKSNLDFPCSSSTRTKLSCSSSLKLKSTSGSTLTPVLKSRRSSPLCLSKTGGDDEGAPWKAFEKALGNLTRGKSIEDVLKQQIEKKEFFTDREGGGGPPRDGGGSGGGGGGADGSGGPEDDGVLDEVIQVVLATLAFIFMYIYIITGEELLKLFKDYIKYVFKGTESVRLKRAMNQWRKFRKNLTPVKVEEDPYWLEKAILSTTTWYDSPEKDRIIYDALWAEQQKSSRSDEESNSQKASMSDEESNSQKPSRSDKESNSGFYDDTYSEEDDF